MTTPYARRCTLLRATAVTAVALGVIVVIWHMRPADPTTAAAPDSAVVLGCAWLAWALVGYLALAVAVTSLGHACSALRPAAGLAPRSLRRLVDAAITLSVATTLIGTSAGVPATAAPGHQASSTRELRPATSGSLDWPGLPDPLPRTTGRAPHPRTTSPNQPPRASPSHDSPAPTRHQRAHVGLVGGGHAASPAASPHEADAGEVVVQAGDSLWKIAARHLGPHASAQATVIAWHQWFAANRQVVGDNPDLIHPGQRLRPPQRSAAR